MQNHFAPNADRKEDSVEKDSVENVMKDKTPTVNSTRKCKGTCTVYARIVGYFSAISQWNPGKKEEHYEKKYYDIQEKDTKE